jgi:hypothetical protein
MKGPASGLALSFLLLHISTNAQDNKAPRDDSSAIRATVRNYIEGITPAMLLGWSEACILTTSST